MDLHSDTLGRIHWNHAAIRAAIMTDDPEAVKREVMRHHPTVVAQNVKRRAAEVARRNRQRRLMMGIMTAEDYESPPTVTADGTDDATGDSGSGGVGVAASPLLPADTIVCDEDAFGLLAGPNAADVHHRTVMNLFMTDIGNANSNGGHLDDADGVGPDGTSNTERIEYDEFGGRKLNFDDKPSVLEAARARAAEAKAQRNAKHPHTAALKQKRMGEDSAQHPALSASFADGNGEGSSSKTAVRRPPPQFLAQGVIHVAAANNKFNIVEWVLSVAPEAVFWAADTCKWTPLHYAAFNGHEAVCALLLRSNADRDAEDVYGDTAGEVAGQSQSSAGTLALLGEYTANYFSGDDDEDDASSTDADKSEDNSRRKSSLHDEGGAPRMEYDANGNAMPIVGVADEGAKNKRNKTSKRAADDDEDPADRARRLRQRRRRRAAKAKQQSTLEEKLLAQAKALEEELKQRKLVEERLAKEAEERRQVRRDLVSRRKEARQYYEDIRVALMLDWLQARQRLAFDILCDYEQLTRSNGIQYYYEHVVEPALADSNAWWAAKRSAEEKELREAQLAAEKARRKKARQKAKRAASANSSRGGGSRVTSATASRSISPAPSTLGINKSISGVGSKSGPTAAVSAGRRRSSSLLEGSVEDPPIVALPPPIPIHYQNVFHGLSFAAEKDFPIPEALLPGSKVFLNKTDKIRLTKVKNSALKKRKENRELLALAHTQLDALKAEERVIFESIEAVARKQLMALWLCEAATFIYFPCEPSLDRQHYDVGTGRLGKYQYTVETEVFRWNCCGQKDDPCAPGCVAAPDELRPTYHPGSYRYHLEDGSCCWHLMTAKDKRLAKERLTTQQKQRSVGAAAKNVFAATEKGRRDEARRKRRPVGEDGSDDTDDGSSGSGSDSSVNTHDLAKEDVAAKENAAGKSSQRIHGTVDADGTIHADITAKSGPSSPTNRNGPQQQPEMAVGSGSGNTNTSQGSRLMLKHPNCNPSGYSWTCCGSTDAEEDGCTSRRRLIYLRHQLLSAPFSVLHLPTCLEDREQVYMRQRFPLKSNASPSFGIGGEEGLFSSSSASASAAPHSNMQFNNDYAGFAEEGDAESGRFSFRQRDGSFLLISQKSGGSIGGGNGGSSSNRRRLSFNALKMAKGSRREMHTAFRTTGFAAGSVRSGGAAGGGGLGNDPLDIDDDFSHSSPNNGYDKHKRALPILKRGAGGAAAAGEGAASGGAVGFASDAAGGGGGASKPGKVGVLGRGFFFRNRATANAEPQRPTDAELAEQAARETHRRQKVFSRLRRQIINESGINAAGGKNANFLANWDFLAPKNAVPNFDEDDSFAEDSSRGLMSGRGGGEEQLTPRVRPVTAEDMLKKHEEKVKAIRNGADPSSDAGKPAQASSASTPQIIGGRSVHLTARQQQQKRAATNAATFLMKSYHQFKPPDRALVVVLQPGAIVGKELIYHEVQPPSAALDSSNASPNRSKAVVLGSDDDDANEGEGFAVDDSFVPSVAGKKKIQQNATSTSATVSGLNDDSPSHRRQQPPLPSSSSAAADDVMLSSILEFTMCGRTVRHLGRRVFFPKATKGGRASNGNHAASSSLSPTTATPQLTFDSDGSASGSFSIRGKNSTTKQQQGDNSSDLLLLDDAERQQRRRPIVALPPPGTLGDKSLKTNATRTTIFASLAVQPYSLYEHVYLDNKKKAAQFAKEQREKKARAWGKLKQKASIFGGASSSSPLLMSPSSTIGGAASSSSAFSKTVKEAVLSARSAAAAVSSSSSPLGSPKSGDTLKSTVIVDDPSETTNTTNNNSRSPSLAFGEAVANFATDTSAADAAKDGALEGTLRPSDAAQQQQASSAADEEEANNSNNSKMIHSSTTKGEDDEEESESIMSREYARRHPLPPQTSREYQRQIKLAGQIGGGGSDNLNSIASRAVSAAKDTTTTHRSSANGLAETESDAKRAVALNQEAVLRARAQKNSGGYQPFGSSALLYRPLRSNVVAFEYVIVKCPVTVVAHQLGGAAKGSAGKMIDSREQMVLGVCLRDLWWLGKNDWSRSKKRLLAQQQRRERRKNEKQLMAKSKRKASSSEDDDGSSSADENSDSSFDADDDDDDDGFGAGGLYGHSPFFAMKESDMSHNKSLRGGRPPSQQQHTKKTGASSPSSPNKSGGASPPPKKRGAPQRRPSAGVPLLMGDAGGADESPATPTHHGGGGGGSEGRGKALSSRVLFELAMKKLWDDSIAEDRAAELARRRTMIGLGGSSSMRGGDSAEGSMLLPVTGSVAVDLFQQQQQQSTAAAATAASQQQRGDSTTSIDPTLAPRLLPMPPAFSFNDALDARSRLRSSSAGGAPRPASMVTGKNGRSYTDNSLKPGTISSLVIVDPTDEMVPPNVFHRKNYFDPMNPGGGDSDEEAEEEAMRLLDAGEDTDLALAVSRKSVAFTASRPSASMGVVGDNMRRVTAVNDGVIRRRRSTVYVQLEGSMGRGGGGGGGRRQSLSASTHLRRRSRTMPARMSLAAPPPPMLLQQSLKAPQRRPAPQSDALAVPATVPELMTQHNIYIGSGGGGRPDDASAIRPMLLKSVLAKVVGFEKVAASPRQGHNKSQSPRGGGATGTSDDEEGDASLAVVAGRPAGIAKQRPASAVSTIASASDDTASNDSFRRDGSWLGGKDEDEGEDDDTPREVRTVQQQADIYEKELESLQIAMAAQCSIGWWAHSTHIRGLGGMVSEEAKETYGKENDTVAIVIDGPNNSVFFFKNRALVATVTLPTRQQQPSSSSSRAAGGGGAKKDPKVEEQRRAQRNHRFEREARRERHIRRHERRLAREEKRREAEARAAKLSNHANGGAAPHSASASNGGALSTSTTSAAAVALGIGILRTTSLLSDASSSTSSSDGFTSGAEDGGGMASRSNSRSGGVVRAVSSAGNVSIGGASSGDDGELSWSDGSSAADSFGSRSASSDDDDECEDDVDGTRSPDEGSSSPRSTTAAAKLVKMGALSSDAFKGGKFVQYTPRTLLAAIEMRLDPSPIETMMVVTPPSVEAYERVAGCGAHSLLLPQHSTSDAGNKSASRGGGRSGSPPPPTGIRGNSPSGRVGGVSSSTTVASQLGASAAAAPPLLDPLTSLPLPPPRAVDFSYSRSLHVSPLLAQLARETVLMGTDVNHQHRKWRGATTALSAANMRTHNAPSAGAGAGEDVLLLAAGAQTARPTHQQQQNNRALIPMHPATASSGVVAAATDALNNDGGVSGDDDDDDDSQAATRRILHQHLPRQMTDPLKTSTHLSMCFMFEGRADPEETQLVTTAASRHPSAVALTVDELMMASAKAKAAAEAAAAAAAAEAARVAAARPSSSGKGGKGRRAATPAASKRGVSSPSRAVSPSRGLRQRSNSADYQLPPPSSGGAISGGMSMSTSVNNSSSIIGGTKTRSGSAVAAAGGGAARRSGSGLNTTLPPLSLAAASAAPLDDGTSPKSRKSSSNNKAKRAGASKKKGRSEAAEAHFVETMRMYEQNPRFRALCGTSAGRLMSLLLALHGHDSGFAASTSQSTSPTSSTNPNAATVRGGGGGVPQLYGVHDGTNDAAQHRIPLKKWQRVQGYNNQVWVPAVTLVQGCAISAEPTYGRPWLSYVDSYFKNRVGAERIFRLGYFGRKDGVSVVGGGGDSQSLSQQHQHRASSISSSLSTTTSGGRSGGGTAANDQAGARFLTATTLKMTPSSMGVSSAATIPGQIQNIRTGQFLARLNSLHTISREMEEKKQRRAQQQQQQQSSHHATTAAGATPQSQQQQQPTFSSSVDVNRRSTALLGPRGSSASPSAIAGRTNSAASARASAPSSASSPLLRRPVGSANNTYRNSPANARKGSKRGNVDDSEESDDGGMVF